MENFQDLPAKAPAGGIDSYSSKGKIGEDYVEDALNMDCDASGKWSTRRGYETYYGWLPLRVRRFVQNGTTIKLYFDTSQSIDLAQTGKGPLIVYGKLPAASSYGTSSFSDENNGVYFSSYQLESRETISGSGSIVRSAADTGLTSKYMFVGMLKALSPSDVSNSVMVSEAISIDPLTFEVTMSYDTTVSEDIFFIYKSKEAESGRTYIAALSGASADTYTITAVDHNLDNFQIGVRVFDETSGDAVEVVPELLTLSSDGTIEITINTAISGFAILTCMDVGNSFSSAAVAGTNSIEISGPPSPYCFYYIYAFDSGLGKYVAVTPQEITYDAASDETTIEYVLAATSENVEVYFEDAITVSNILSVTDAGSATLDLENPSLTVWGIGHENIYRPDAPKGGWSNHIDNYKSALEETIIAGVGGCVYSAGSRETSSDDFLIPAKYPNLRSRTSGERFLGPLFSTTSTLRTRGSVFDASIEANLAVVTAIAFVSSGVVDVTLSFTNKTGSLTIGTELSTYDILTLSNTGDERNQGEFPILSVQSDSTTSAVIRIANSVAVDTTINETAIRGRAGVFTDVAVFTAAHKFVAGDHITADGISSQLEIVSVVASASVLVAVEELVTLPDGLNMYGTRTSRVIPTRNESFVLDVANFVAGDSVETPFVTNKPVILNVNPDADATVIITVEDGIATVEFSLAHKLNVGGYVFVYGDTTNGVNGEHVVVSTTTTDTLTFETEAEDGSYSAKVLGQCIELDEGLEWYDSNSVDSIAVVGRWLPIEAPDRGESAAINDTAFQYFNSSTYANQPVLSSIVVADTMLFTNGDDEVMKYDGSSIYEAGLRRVIPSVFMAFDNSVPSILKGFEVDYTSVSVAGKYFQIEVDAFSVGDRVYDDGTETIFTIVEKQLVPDTINKYNLVVSGDTSGLTGTGTLTKVKRFRSYLRFNMIDRNNNVIASAAVNSGDMYFDVVEDGRIIIKTSYYPLTGYGDFSRIELEYYKTRSDTSAPFYLAKRIALNFDYTAETSIEIVDDVDDEFLTQLDAVNTSLLGAEIGTGWQPPYRAGLITTFDNSTIIGDLKSWPRFDITLKAKATTPLIKSDLYGMTFLFRKNSADTDTDADFENRVGIELTGSAFNLGVATSFTFANTDVNTTTDQITKTAHAMRNGDVVKLTGTLPSPLVAGTAYYVRKVDDNTFSLCASVEDVFVPTVIDLTTQGSGTISLTSGGAFLDDVMVKNDGATIPDGSWIYLFFDYVETDGPSFAYSGWFQTEQLTDHSYRLLGFGRGEQTFGAPTANALVTGSDGFIPVWMDDDYNYGQVNGNSDGSVELLVARRIADAINFTMTYSRYLVKEDFPDFSPWLVAYAGADYKLGQVVVESQLQLSTTPELVLGTIPDKLGVFVNNLARESDEQVGASTYLYPSRLGISYKNFPEIFDTLDGTRETSDSVVDINPADGQSLIGAVPFFGDAAFGAAQVGQVVVVFKSNSVYVLDKATREYQRLGSRNIGAIAPKSITPGKDCIMFVSTSGIYRITSSLKLEFVGEMMEGRWKDLINKNQLEGAAATHWGEERQVKISLPAVGESANSYVFVYKYDREEKGLPGAWTRYDNFPAVLWCNQRENNFFSSTEGVVYQIRKYNEDVDYRDNTSAIDTAWLPRAEDFGLPGVRKTVVAISVEIDTSETSVSSVSVSTAVNLSQTFTECGNLTIVEGENPVIRCTPDIKKGNRFQTKITHSAYDEKLVISGLNYKTARNDSAGTKQAAAFGGANGN